MTWVFFIGLSPMVKVGMKKWSIKNRNYSTYLLYVRVLCEIKIKISIGPKFYFGFVFDSPKR